MMKNILNFKDIMEEFYYIFSDSVRETVKEAFHAIIRKYDEH